MRAVERRARGIDQYIFFLNDVDGAAPANASALSARIQQLLGDPAAPLVCNGWRRDRDVSRDGPGSILGMFKKAAAKHAAGADSDDSERAKRPAAPPPQGSPATASPHKGPLDAFLAPKPS